MEKEGATAMKTSSKSVKVFFYGRLLERMKAFASTRVPIWKRLKDADEMLIIFSNEMDDGFAEILRECARRELRLLILNDSQSSDRLLSRFVNLQIRSSHRFYVADPPSKKPSEEHWEELVRAYLVRLTAASKSKEDNCRILDARLEQGILHVVSTDFQRLDVPIAAILLLAKSEKKTAEHFEIDEDGSYIYWPEMDLHLGWEQFQQIVDPVAVQRAKQKSREFNIRYGAAIRKIREEKELPMTAIAGLSSKQLRRIERGECRLTSNTARKLAQAHDMTPNEYLNALAAALNKVN
jgi:hypothetical protein